MKTTRIFTLAAALALTAASGRAQILYQGSLTQSGLPVNATVPMTVRLVSADGAAQFWTSGSTSVPVSGGKFRYLLGGDNDAAFNAIDWNTAKPYVELTVNGSLLLPREPLRWVPYSLLARALIPGATLQAPVINMAGGRVAGVGSPVWSTDAANKAYVDAAVAGVSAGTGGTWALPSNLAYTTSSNTFSAAGGNSFTYGVNAGSLTVAGGLTAASASFGSGAGKVAISTAGDVNVPGALTVGPASGLLSGLGRGSGFNYNVGISSTVGGVRWVDGGANFNGPLPGPGGGALLHFDPLFNTSVKNQYALQIAQGYDQNANDFLFWRSQFGGSWQPWRQLLTTDANGTFSVAASTFVVAGGKVGIGTTAPAAKLDVAGTARLIGSGDVGGGYLQLANTGKTTPGQGYSWNIYNMTGGYGNKLSFWNYDYANACSGGMCNERLSLYDNGTVYIPGNLGIGTTSPAAKLEVKGGAIKATDGLILQIFSASDTTTPRPTAEGSIWLEQ